MTNTTISVLPLVVAAGLFAGSASAQDCKPSGQYQTVEPGKLTVAATTYAPFSYLGSDGTLQGVDGDIVNAIAKRECLKVYPIATEPSAAIQYILTGRADVSTGDWYRTVQRAQVVNLSDPLYTDEMGIYSKEGYSSVDDFKDKSVGTVQGYLWVADLQKLLGADLKLYPNSSALSRDLQAGRIDVGVDGYASGRYAQAKGGFQGLQIKVAKPDKRVDATRRAAQAGLPISKSNAGLTKAIDRDIAAFHKDGTIKSILTANQLDPSAADVGKPRLVE
ncbi:transporter substrate-binding domain-containing protein [Jiella sp. MQZ9-1]|uniref:Amino acid ABC transporter substrate-binding protein n=1 Tax=Jiella flava TaxID=2816857 RepID=A0A939JXD8_9HYPH|nr:transporter substrate-binding domain-containing protein [Jiella flava]MBO0663967.1 amino acid ABC transporter substrate-binding protein [Jiella flava]MCD2472538.1 transporter substrate-binding domain-containing protein [Jiella flava]